MEKSCEVVDVDEEAERIISNLRWDDRFANVCNNKELMLRVGEKLIERAKDI